LSSCGGRGKSFWVYDAVMHIALGREYRGRSVQPGAVVYVACEGERGLGARTAAFRRRKLADGDDPPFFLLATRLDLVADADVLISDIKNQIAGAGCSTITVDTLNRSIAGSESRDEDMGNYVKAADKLREAFGGLIVLIHHCGINGERPRGHTSLTGACDAQIAVKRDEVDRIIATVEFMKDGAEGDEIISRLAVADVGYDEDGEPITSCVIERADGEARTRPAQPRKKLASAARVGLEQLKNCMADNAVDIPASNHVPRSVKGVTLEQWQGYLAKAGIINMKGSYREQFKRIRVTLQDAGFIGVWGDFV
jgi:AAA domain